MNGSVTGFHGKNGVLRKFRDAEIGDVLVAKVSQDGSFCAAVTVEGLATFPTLRNQPVKLHVHGNIRGFSWIRHARNAAHDLSFPGPKSFLIALDPECNVCIYSAQRNDKLDEPCKVELASFISKEMLIDANGAGNFINLEVIDAIYDDSCYEFGILLLVDNERLIRILTKQEQEPFVDLDIKLNQYSGIFDSGRCGFICSKVKSSLLLLVDEHAMLYIICLESKVVLQKFSLTTKHSISTDSVEEYNDQGDVYHLCSISSNFQYVLIFDEENEILHQVQLNVEEIALLSFKIKKPEEMDDDQLSHKKINDIAAMYGIVIQNEVWRNELNTFHKEITDNEALFNEEEIQSHQAGYGTVDSQDSVDMQRDAALIVQTQMKIALPDWTAGYKVKQLTLGTNVALIRMTIDEDDMPLYHKGSDKTLNSIILQYDLQKGEFIAQSLPEKAVIAVNESGFFPNCILSKNLMYISTLDSTQEQLISSIIQYTGIAEAETICRANQWSQFSIPLHSLEVGLQHRQIDTISFFLRTRDKAFSRYWKHASQSSMTSESSAAIANKEEFTGSPSLKSILVKSSMESTSVDPNELHKAVDMLIKGIHHSSKGKHKKNFFETLLRLTIDFLNSLIMDGAGVLESLGHKQSHDNKDREVSFTFLADIPESLNYLVKCIVDVRQFISDIPDLYTIKDNDDVVDGVEAAKSFVNISLKEHMEAEIFDGRLAHLQKHLLEREQDTVDCSFEALTEFGLDFAFRKLKQRKIDEAVSIMKNLGTDEKAILRQLFDVTLDRDLRTYLLSEFDKEPYSTLLSGEDVNDVKYLKVVEEMYPCMVYNKDSIEDKWEALKANLHDIDDKMVDEGYAVTLKSLDEHKEENVKSQGLYSELMFKWVKEWDDSSRKMVLLDAAFHCNRLEHIDEITDTVTLWEYLINHNDVEHILDWIRTSQNHSWTSSNKRITYPPFDPNLIHRCGNASKQVQKAVYREFVRLGIYTEDMKRDFERILKLMSEDCALFKKSDDAYTFPQLFVNHFMEYCLKNNLREILYIYLDHHELYPAQNEIGLEQSEINSHPWFKMISAFRNYQKDKQGILEMSLNTAENILNASGEELKIQLCQNRPLTVLGTVLTSSLKLNEVFDDEALCSNWISETLLKESLKSYPTLYAAVFKNRRESDDVTTVQLLQDNTELDAIKFFNWRKSGDNQSIVPNFSSQELVENFGLRINMTYIYYLKQKRPVHAYLIFIKDVMQKPDEKEYWMKRAFLETYKLAIDYFDNIPVAAACICFVDLLDMDSYSMRVDIESANFILLNLKKTGNNLFESEEKLKTFLVTSLKKEEDGRSLVLEMLEECVEAELNKENICWSSFEAILYYRIAVQFAQISGLAPPTRLIEETIKDGCWFHAIVFMQMYQLKPTEILQSLEKCMKNTVLLDHLHAIIKNAKEMTKMADQPQEAEQSPRREMKLKQRNQGAALKRDFRAQFYFNLKKGRENKLVEGSELLSPTKSAATPAAIERVQKQSLNRSSSESSESINERAPERRDASFYTVQHLDNILDIVIECEDTGAPSSMLLKYATSYSQPFLAVLAACYQECNLLNCLSSWLISSIEKNCRHKVFKSLPDIGKPDWSIEEMFCLLSDVLENEEKSIKIIADGFKIFMHKNATYPYFKFCDSFAAKEDQAACSQYLQAFVSSLGKMHESSPDNDFVRTLFEARIPIKVLIKFKSNFYKRKLLQVYIDAGLDTFLPQNSISFTRLKTICELTKDTKVTPDYLLLASCVQNRVAGEENRIYELLIEQKHLEKALQMSKLLDLPAWKVTFSEMENRLLEMKKSGLWHNPAARCEFWTMSDTRLRKCFCSHAFAGSFYEAQGLNSEDLPYEERAFLLAMAFSWYVNQPVSESMTSIDLKRKLDELEKNAWRFKMNAEIKRIELVEVDSSEQQINSKVLHEYSMKLTELLCRRSRTGSGISYHDNENNLLILDDVFACDVREDKQWNEKENEAFELMIGELLESGEIAQAKRVSYLFRKTTRDLDLVLTSISLAQGIQQVDSLDESLKILLAQTPTRSLSISGSYDQSVSLNRSISTPGSTTSTGKLMSEWVIIEEIQNAIEKLLSKCKKGRRCCERILICFKISMVLSLSYGEVVSLQPFTVLRRLIFSDTDQQLSFCRQFIKVFCIKDEEVAAFIAKLVLRLIQSKANIALSSLTVQEFTDTTKLNSSEIPRLMQLAQNPSLLGSLLLEEAKSIASNQKSDDDINFLEVNVELLIRAHDCFTLSCNMEGISEVLHAARLCNLQLIKSKSYSLMVRMLTGIGRFKEMSYIFEALAEEHHFELLFRKDIEKEAQLKSALLDYIKKHHPNDTEKIDMLSMRFGMHREVGEQFEETGEKQIRAITNRFSAMSKDMETDLKSIAKTFSYAAANYKKVACLQKSTRCLKIARLAELQIRLLPQGKQIIGLDKLGVKKLLCSHQDFYEALIIADAYNQSSPLSWVDPLFERVILKGEMTYMKQYLSVFHLTSSVLMEIVSRYRSERSSSNSKEHLKELLSHLRDVKLRYKIAVEFNFNDVINNILEKADGAYIKDSIYSY